MKKYKNERKSKFYTGNRLGFTLVEAITTLVVLAIVAAVSIPSLVGYIDSSREKIAVQECSTVVEAANALGVEHVLETGVVNYDEVVPLADSSEPGKSVYSSVTKEAILKRAELEDKGEIKNFSFDPNDSHGYTQPAYLVNEEEVVVSAAAEITLAKDIVSPLAVSVEKTTDTEFKEAAGISLTSLEYTASNGIDVVYHNGGYQASSKVDIDFEHHDLEATVKQVLTCEQDEIVLFRCSGCEICDGTNNYSVTAVTAFAPGHNYGALTCVGKDQHEQTCTNVLNRLAKGDKALSEGDDLDLEPQYDDFNNLPRVGVECTDNISGNHFGDINEDVELTEDLERDIPFSLDGVYKSSGDVPAGKYKVTTCSGCGYSEYVMQMPDGLVIIDNDNDNVADKATISKESIESGNPLVFETVSEAVNYINIANKIDNQTIKLLGNVTETEAVNVAGETLTHITITSRSGNRYTWKGVDLHFASKTQADSSITLENIVIDNGNAAQIPVQASYGVTILGNGATIKNVKDCAVELTGGTFEMHDGAVITNCSSSKNSGGAISEDSNGGTINLYGGTIENCSCVGNGGAICVNSETTLNIKGNPVVVNNTATQKGNNIYLESGKTLNVVGDISGAKTIGIESADDVRNQVSGEFGVNNNASYSSGKTIAAFKNDVNDSLHAEVKDGKVIWAEEKKVDRGTGNWYNQPSDEKKDGLISVTGKTRWNKEFDKELTDDYRNKHPGEENTNIYADSPYGSEITINNNTSKYIKRFSVTIQYDYSGFYNDDRSYNFDDLVDYKVSTGSKDIGLTKDEDINDDDYNFDYGYKIDKEKKTVTIFSYDHYTQRAIDYQLRNSQIIAPGVVTSFYVDFGKPLLSDACYYIVDYNIEFIDTWATEVELKCNGDASAIKRIGYNTWDVSSCDANGNVLPNDGNIYPDGTNPIRFYLLAGNQALDSYITIKLFGNDPNLCIYEFQISRRELVANADNEGKIVIEVPALDFGLRIKHSDFDAYNYAKKIRISGAGVSKTVDIDGFKRDTYVTGIIHNKNSRDNITISILSENNMVIATGEIAQEIWKNYTAGNSYEVTVSPTAFVLKLKTFITDSSISAKSAEINIKGADVYTDNKTVNINGGSANILVVPKADKITVNLKANGKTVATKDIEIPQLGTTGSITITNDDIYTGPDIPEPDKDKVNVYVKYNGKFKDDIKEIAFCNYYNTSQPILPPYEIDNNNIIVTDDGFVVANFQLPALWTNPIAVVLKGKYNVNTEMELAKNNIMLQYSDVKNSYGGTLEVEVQSTAMKVNIHYSGNYSEIKQLKFDGAKLPYPWDIINVNPNSNNIGSFFIVTNNNTDINITIGSDVYNGIKGTYTIPWSDIQAHLGDELNVTIEPK